MPHRSDVRVRVRACARAVAAGAAALCRSSTSLPPAVPCRAVFPTPYPDVCVYLVRPPFSIPLPQ